MTTNRKLLAGIISAGLFWNTSALALDIPPDILNEVQQAQVGAAVEKLVPPPMATGCDAVKDGLVACYPFDGNANDTSGNGNHGTVNGGATLTTDRFGNPNSAYLFDGVDDVILANNPFASATTNTNPFSISVWINTTNTDKAGGIVTQHTACDRYDNDHFYIELYGAATYNQLKISVYDSLGANVPITMVADGKWHHITLVYEKVSQDLQTTLYVDGNIQGSVNATPVAGTSAFQFDPTTRVAIGGLASNICPMNQNFQGSVDDVRIYNRVLTETEVKQLAGVVEPAKVTLTVAKTGNGQITGNGITCGTDCTEDLAPNTQVTLTATATTGSMFKQWTGDCTGTTATVTVTMDKAKSCTATFDQSSSATTSCDMVKDGLVACYLFDGNANDGSGNGQNGTLHGNVQYVNGIHDQAAKFSAYGDMIQLPNTSLNGTLENTISLWLKMDNSQPMGVLSAANPTYDNEYLLFIGSSSFPNKVGKIQIDHHGAYYFGNIRIDDGEFHHVAVATDANANLKVYVDGVLDLTINSDKATPLSVTSYVWLGQEQDAVDGKFDPNQQLQGLLDDLRIYNRTLSETEVKQLAGIEPAKVTLTVTKTGNGQVTGNGITCGTDCTEDLAPNTQVTLTATATTGSMFKQWTGDCTGTTATVTVTMDKAKSCTATFDQSSSATTSCDMVKDGLVACYLFDGNANDGSGNGNHGTVKGGATLTTDRLGNANSAYRLDGVNGYIETADSPTLNVGTGDYSMAIWVRYEGNGSVDVWNVRGVLMDKREPVIAKGYSLYFRPGQPGTQIADNGKYHSRNFQGQAVLEDGQWHHVIASVERKSTTGLKLYMDGKLIATHDPTSFAGSLDNPGTFKIGHSFGLPEGKNVFLNGSVDDVRLYKRALSETEVKQLAGVVEPAKVTLTITKTGDGTVTGQGIDCGTDCTEDLAPNTQVTLTATATTGSMFKQWTGDCTGTTATVTVTMDKAKSCTATFDQSSSATTSCDAVKDGLVACYPFDGNANDESGNGLHGTKYGDVTYVPGKIGQAAKFDGLGDYIEVANNSALNPAQFTISAWIQVANLAQLSGDSSPHNHHIVFNKENQYELAVFGSAYPTVNEVAASELSFAINPNWNWYSTGYYPKLQQFSHVVLTFSDNKIAKLYIDGKNVKQVTYSKPITTTGNNLRIGARKPYGNSDDDAIAFFNGLIDDLRIYNRALSEAEIQQLYGLGTQPAKVILTVTKTGNGQITSNGITCGTDCTEDLAPNTQVTLTATATTGSMFKQWTGDCTGTTATVTVTMDKAKSCTATFDQSSSATTSCDVVKEGLVACYPFDGNANDASGNGHHGTVKGTMEYIQGVVGQSAKFNGSSYIDVPHASAFNLQKLTISAWVYETVGTEKQFILLKGRFNGDWTSNNQRQYALSPYRTDNKEATRPVSQFDLFNTSLGWDSLYSNSQATIGMWKHIVATYDGQKMKLFVNGVLDGEKTVAVTLFTPTDPQSMTIGAGINVNNGSYGNQILYLNGLLDDLRIYNRALSDAEVKQLYGLGTQPAKVTLTVAKTGNGQVTGNGIDCGTDCTEANLAANTQVTLTATPDTGYQFVSWAGVCTGTDPTTTVTLTANQTCAATFELIPPPAGIALTVNKADADRGRISGRLRGETATSLTCDNACQTASYNYPKDGVVIVTATAQKGYEFKTWTCIGSSYTQDPATPNILKVTMTTATTCTANFDAIPGQLATLTVNLIGTGSGTVASNKVGFTCQGSQCTGTYAIGQKLTLTATPSPFATFVNWGSDCTGTTKLKVSVTLTKDMTCTAQYQSNPQVAAQQMVQAFYDQAITAAGDVASLYPPADNTARLQEAFEFATLAILQADSHLATTGQWPTQLSGLPWYQKHPLGQYTDSLQLQPGEYLDLRLKLKNNAGVEQEVAIIIYYQDQPPVLADDGNGWYSIPIYVPKSFTSQWGW